METVERDYSGQGVQFIYVYKALAHPEWNGYVTPVTFAERLLHVQEAKRTLGTRFRWICDAMDHDLKRAFGNAPNSEWVIDPDGIVVRRRDWSNADSLRRDLEELIGPVANPTRVEDLDMPTAPPLTAAASGVVKRLEREERMRPLKVDHARSLDNEPFYAKLRAEAGRETIASGSGELYLRFMMDPLYRVHWNNKVDPIQVRIEAPAGITVTPATLVGPTITAAEGDIDPREFLVDVRGVKEGDTITLRALYYPCTDTWCRLMTQEYIVHFVPDRDAGSVISPGTRGRKGKRRGRRDPDGAGE